MKNNSYYIVERNNPQFKKPYYIKRGQLSKREANKSLATVYGTNYLIECPTYQEYIDKINELVKQGFDIS